LQMKDGRRLPYPSCRHLDFLSGVNRPSLVGIPAEEAPKRLALETPKRRTEGASHSESSSGFLAGTNRPSNLEIPGKAYTNRITCDPETAGAPHRSPGASHVGRLLAAGLEHRLARWMALGPTVIRPLLAVAGSEIRIRDCWRRGDG
jgi:hypothetical protein